MSELINGIASGLNSLLSEYDAISHNIANCNTPGFKKRYTSFTAKIADIENPNFNPLATSIDSKDSIDFSQGQLYKTDSPLDIALDGNGFIALETPSGSLYTRNGVLQINILNQLTDLNGHLVAGQNGPITIPQSINVSDLSISSTGLISAGEVKLGQLGIVEFEDAANELEPVGNSCFRPLEGADPQPSQNVRIHQGYRENSNVQTAQELTHLMLISRIFETNTDFLKKQTESSQAILGVANS